eukprot:968295_1
MFLCYLNDSDSFKTGITNLMVKCKFLDYICFSVATNHFSYFLEGIECGLFKTKTQQRKQLKLFMELIQDPYCTFEANDFILNIGRIVSALETSNINDFKFILGF